MGGAMGACRSARAALAGLGLAVALAGCGSGAGAGGDGSGQGSKSPPAPVVSPTADVAACFEGRCRIRVTEQPTRIPVDARFGVGSLEVTDITARSVVVQASGNGRFMASAVGEGGTGSLNGLGFRVEDVHDGQAVLDFFPQE
ncbi:hypothetical protein AB0D11_29910 [Streptomyces monashensis]|uniref:hypothetical protein n=1 Tax=Streptomyces monashensis TaxID=1678012 RepID=UPI0033D41AE8